MDLKLACLNSKSGLAIIKIIKMGKTLKNGEGKMEIVTRKGEGKAIKPTVKE